MNTINIWFQRIVRSKTMLFNMFVALAAGLEGAFSLLQPFLPGDVFAYFTVILIVGNKVLRVVTTQPLTDK